MTTNLLGKYGQQYKEFNHKDSDLANSRSNCSPSIPSGTNKFPFTQKFVEDGLLEKPDGLGKMANKQSNGEEQISITKEFTDNEELKMGSQSPHDEVDDALTRARFLATQQFFLQTFQKRRQLLLTAAHLQDTASSENDNKNIPAPLPFAFFPFNLSPTALIHSAFPNVLQGHNISNEAIQNEIEQKSSKTEADVLDRIEKYPTGQAENALMLFSQIQNYRRHLLESGSVTFPIGSVDSNSFRRCDNLIPPS